MVETIITNGTVVTMAEPGVLEDGAVVVADGDILAVGPTDELRDDYDAPTVIDAEGRAVLPGFVSAHTHVSDILLRGGPSTDRDTYDWLFNVKQPGVSTMTVDDHELAVALYCTEAVAGGITTFVENATGPPPGYDDDILDTKADVYESAGVRAVYARGFMDWEPTEAYIDRFDYQTDRDPDAAHVHPEVSTTDTDEALARIERSMEAYQDHPLVDVWPAPYYPKSTTPAGLRGAYDLAERYDVMTTLHAWGDLSAIEYLDTYDYLGERALLGHCVDVNRREMRLLADTDTRVAHNFVTNLVGGDGFAPLTELLDLGVTVGIGTDNTSLSNTVSLLNDMRVTASAHKAHHQDGTVVPARRALRMATVEGARAIGREDELGSIEPGKRADLVVYDLRFPHLRPIHDVVSTIVYGSYGHEVEATLCDGEVVYRRGEETGIRSAYPDVADRAQSASAALLRRAGIVD